MIVDENLNIIDRFYKKVRPSGFSKRSWQAITQKFHGFSFEQIMKFMPSDQFCYELLCFFGKYKEHFPMDFVCHASNTGMPNIDPITKKPKGGYAMVPWIDWTFLEWCFKKENFANGDSMASSFYKVFQWNEVSIELDGQEKPYLLNGNTRLISTIQMARELKYKGNRLDEWAKRIGFKLDHHNAESDTLCCLEVFKKLWPEYNDNILKYRELANGIRT